MYKSFLIKYGEIGIKGKNRYLFENALVRQIRYALKRIDGEFEVYKDQARIFVDCSGDYDYDETVDALQHVFGIVGICPMVRAEDKGFEALAEDVIAFMGKTHPEGNYTFKVNARRARKDYPMLSMEVNAALGEKILKAFPETKVDVHNPEIVVNVEIRDEIYIYSKIIPVPAVCLWEPTEKPCCFFPAESTAGSRLHGSKTRCSHRRGLFPCTAIYQ